MKINYVSLSGLIKKKDLTDLHQELTFHTAIFYVILMLVYFACLVCNLSTLGMN